MVEKKSSKTKGKIKEFHENIELNDMFSKTKCISSMIDINLENKIFLRVITLHQSAIRENATCAWNLIRALARVNTRIVHSLALND